jgi:hypothetical protein
MFSARPYENDTQGRFAIIAMGQELDHHKVASSRDELLKGFYETSGRTDIEFGELICAYPFKPNVRMVDKFGIDRVFVAGGKTVSHAHAQID